MRSQFGRVPPQWQRAVRAIVEATTPEPLQKVAARQGWWALGVADLQPIAKHLDIALPDKPSLAEALVGMMQATLGVDEEGALTLLAGRLVVMPQHEAPVVDELLELDEASKLLSREDEAEMQKEQQRQVQKRANHQGSFVQEYQERKTRIRTEKACAPKIKRAKKCQGLDRPPPPPPRQMSSTTARPRRMPLPTATSGATGLRRRGRGGYRRI